MLIFAVMAKQLYFNCNGKMNFMNLMNFKIHIHPKMYLHLYCTNVFNNRNLNTITDWND